MNTLFRATQKYDLMYAPISMTLFGNSQKFPISSNQLFASGLGREVYTKADL